jgi:hypothetical protein
MKNASIIYAKLLKSISIIDASLHITFWMKINKKIALNKLSKNGYGSTF